ncbi:hypothetical protein CHGG_02251 [Chaetomium globosum CBS 148.51]|uniref:Carrier domain-containing protein n=1 Tax=Chaetomium globosum (strain ATCC 6205 / CBS 148.51 / DSM 1962 / NBRC 6347 / NRRL 1970) TaxID=306901 RepID=Q2HC03_CHAGB|nr:uncharacterized protein CHGG_02251 [Chaetomium globosum CBS 148.51]EAQ90316.1 hypothetical protein CHGG_02251 [Chaetomium globosum CBS 148.51]
MNNTLPKLRPPITQLRPLHSLQQPSNREFELPRLREEAHLENSIHLVHWSSPLEPKPDKETAIKAFVRLVARIAVIEVGDKYCIEDAERGGFILAHSAGQVHEEGDSGFVDCLDGQVIPTDFSIGEGKALQLHIDAATRQVRLAAQANVVPVVALGALGRMLDDLIVGLQQGQNASVEWTKPSVLNFPPKPRPLDLFSEEPASSVNQKLEDPKIEENGQALLHRWFEQRAAETPERIAVDFLVDLESGKRVQYTYQNIENAANALAAALFLTNAKSQSGTQSSVRIVAALMGPCPELYTSYLAALKAGMAFCPIPVDAPRDRQDALIADLKPTALLVVASQQGHLPQSSPSFTPIPEIDVAPYLASCDSKSETPPLSTPQAIAETDVAYILYTSGTTGMPKGVAVSHISASCTISALSNHFRLVPPSRPSKPIRWYQGAAPTFDISLFEIFWTLSTGSTLCCAPRECTLQDIDRVLRIMEADMTNITPSFASLLDPSSIRGLMVGGETLNTRLLQVFAHHNPPVGTMNGDHAQNKPRGIYNGYGPTETAIYCIAQAHVPATQRGSVIGTPLATCGCLIVDAQTTNTLEPVPMGAVGELVITGPQVSNVGYLNRPEETAAAFSDDARWGRAYRTGDRARIVWGPDGEPVVEFLGRMSDDQVKLSGRRVELGEIESVLASRVDGIRETMACVWKGQSSEAGSERVVSLVVLEPRAGLDFELVRQRCLEVAQRHLPDYMRPFKILLVDALPRSASGKLDRKRASLYVREVLEDSSGPGGMKLVEDDIQDCVGRLDDPKNARLEKELIDMVFEILTDGNSSGTTVTITATTPLGQAGIDSLRAMTLLRDIRKRWPSSGSTHDKHARLQPSLASLLDSGASIRSVFFPPPVEVDTRTKLDNDIQRQLANFSSKYVPEALDKLNLAHAADIEMVLPTTCTQSQLAVSFAMDSSNYISHSVLKLRSDISIERLKEAVKGVISEQAIYRCAILPCDDPLSPFSQAILTPEAWRRFVNDENRVVHTRASTSQLAEDVKPWLDLAEANISLDSQRLYHIQIIEPDSNSDPDLASAGLLVVSMAHCICDGASLEVLMSDISRRYRGLEPLQRHGISDAVFEWASNKNTDTDELWQQYLKGWESEAFGSLSGDNVNPSIADEDRRHGMVEYASDLPWQVLECKSRTLGTSPLSILQASWALLLNLFSESDTGDVLFGSIISGQDLPAHAPTFSVVPCRVALPEAQTISELVDSLVSHSRFAQRYRHTSFGVFKTRPYNTALALQAYAPEGPNSQDGLGETLPDLWTEMQNPAIRYDFPVFVEIFPTNPHSPSRNRQTDKMTFKLTYSEDALSGFAATCIVKQFGALVEVMLGSSPDDLVQGLPARLPMDLLSAEGTIPVPAENKENNDQQSHVRTELLHSQFEDQATSTPDLLALSFYTSLDSPPIELSYAELDARANGLANILREEDVDVIPICLQRSVELYVAILAILKAGSAWCPIDETSPVQRRTSLIARTQSKLLLTTTESLHLVEPCLSHQSLEGVRVILLDKYADQKSPVRASPRDGILSSKNLSGKDLAYLLWTSGTTGEPKGVMIQHSAAAQAMRDLQIRVEHDEKGGQVRTLQLSAYSFDVFVQDLFYTWGIAGSVISGIRELVLGTFVEFIWKSCPTHAHLTPSFGASIHVDELRGSTLQYVTFIGEKLTESVAEAWAAPEITTRAYNTYGPAENAVVSTMRRFYGKSRDRAKAANVGFPLSPCTAYVVREVEVAQTKQKRWELVPRYGIGELALGGAQVAKGYLSNEVKTAKSFIQGVPGIDERIYLTGDVARLNDHGFEFLGRNDDLVKITGIRIELSEISAACASVKDEHAAVEHVETLHLPRPGAGDGNNKVIVTFVSVKKDIVDGGQIRTEVFQRARDLLPAYMVPGHVVVLNTTMPRTASNKVDRKALQEIYDKSDLNVLAGREGNNSGRSPSDGGETKPQWTKDQLPILRIIAEEFKVAIEPLSPGDSLAGLGFSSLQVTKLAWSLKRRLGCAVGVLVLMRCQSLGELVEVVLSKLPDQRAISQTPNGTVPPRPAPETSWIASIKDALTNKLRGDMRPHDTLYVVPATPIQESLIAETMFEPRAYWAHRVFDLGHQGKVDGLRLKEAWTEATRKFDILRTIFVPLTQLEVEHTAENTRNVVTWARHQGIRSTILQLVRREPTVCWTWLSGDEDRDLARWAEKLQMELAPTTTIRPPWSVTFDDRGNKLMLSMHHALYDNVSSEILLDTVAKSYQGQGGDTHAGDMPVPLARGMELGLLPTPHQRDEAASVWDSHLAGTREAVGALNAPFPDLTQSRQKQPRRILLSKKSIPSFLLPSRSAAAPRFPDFPTLFKSAFGCVLASYLELKAVVLGQTTSQRILHPDLARVMGPAMATLPVLVRADAHSAQELWSNMARDSSSLSRTMHNLHPVDIKRILNRGSENSNAPFPGFFVYHPAPGSDGDPEDNSTPQMFRGEEQALSLNVEHPLALNVFEHDGIMELTGDGSRISQAQLDLMLRQIIDQAKAMLESPQLLLHLLPNRMDRALVSISGKANTGEDIGAVDPTDKVSQHALDHPEWVAVEELTLSPPDEGDCNEITTKTITYAQLDRLANAIASSLASHKAHLQADDVVGLYLSRDIKSLAATLAIFRAGYVYLPVDEDLPSARKQLLIRDAGAKLIITTEELAGDLELNLDNDPPALLLPDGDKAVNTMLSWPVSHQRHPKPGHGGYLLYTSGSTGHPKGVRVSNSNLCHFIAAFSARLIESSPATASLGGAGKYLNLTSRAFDPHLTQLFVPWHLGYSVVIGRDRTAILGSLQRVINERSVTHFGSVPSVLTQLGLRPEDMPSVRAVTTGGEKASSELLDMWTKGGPEKQEGEHSGAVLFNFYGPTEVTIGCLGHAVNAHSNARNLGLPLQGLEALLLCPGTGEEQVIARRGQPGELCIAGPQVSMGYLDRPDENAKSFQTTLLLGGGPRRMYRTGDVMRMMHDGTLEFLGRADQQAKIRGQRLELDEVVHFLKQAAVGEGDLDFAAAVVASGDGESSQKQQQLFGFMARRARNPPRVGTNAEVELLKDQGEEWTALLERIEQTCEAGLPAFMVPTMLSVSKIPYLAASGKVDTKLLAKLANDFFAFQQDQQGPAGSATATSPGSALNDGELAVISAVEEAVGNKLHSATATSSIHRLGIDSLSAVHLVSLLRRRGFSKLKMVDILSPSCTVRSIARLADRRLNGSAPAHGMSSSSSADQQASDMAQQGVEPFNVADLGPLPTQLSESQIEAVLPCLPLQSALVARSLSWWLRVKSAGDGDGDEDKAPVEVPYVAQFHYRLSRGTDAGRWKKVAEEVIASEAMLRTCFVQREHDGKIFQVVLRSPPVSPFDCGENAAGIVAEMSIRPPIRLRMQEGEGSGETIVSLKIHHALFDGVAIDLLRKKLEQAYHKQHPTEPLCRNMSLDVLRGISSSCYLSGAQLESARRSWQTKFHGVRQCRVGTDNNNNNNNNDSMVRSTRSLDYTISELKSKLRALSQQSGASISVSTAFQLATALCLAQLTRQTSVVYGFVMSLRPLLAHIIDGTEEFIGPCLNTLVQTLSFQETDEPLPELAQRVHEAHAAACQETLPFANVEQVQRWTGSEERLFDSLLSINLIPADDTTETGDTPEPGPGRMSALGTQSKSDMALAIDVDLHPDGKILLTLSSAGALSETQLDEVGRLFADVVFSAADENARVGQFLPGQQWCATEDAVVPNGHHAPIDAEPGSGLADEGYQQALASVRTAACRLLRLKPSDIPTSAKPTSLYQLGLDSITVIPFVKLINKLENIWLSPDAVIRARTIQNTARLIQEMKTKRSTKPNGNTTKHSTHTRNDKPTKGISDDDAYDATLQRLAKDLLFAATPLQESMLSASLAIADKAYTYTHTIQLSDKALAADTPTLDSFFAAARDTVQACEILRTRFIFTHDDDAPWVGVVSPVEQSDLVHWEVVEAGPPGRVQLRIHHALYDAASIRAVWRILGENYARRLQGRDEIGGQAAVRSHLFRPFARTVALAQRASVAFWGKLVQGYSYTPLHFPDDSLQASSAFHFALSEQELSFLQARCRSLSVTTKAALQLAWVKVLCESLYGQADVVYGEVISTEGGFDGGANGGVNGDAVVVGPTINTVPMRVKLAGDRGTPVRVAEALVRVQQLSDDARGTVAMGSLRKIQALWRSSSRDREHLPAALFQSLFVFDGIVDATSADSDGLSKPLFNNGAQTQTQNGKEESDDGPAYDDTPVIVSFQVQNGTLRGKLRAKMTGEDVETLGSRLEAALRWVLSCEVSDPALDIGPLDILRKKGSALESRAADNRGSPSERNGSNSAMADTILELVKKVLGTRCRGKDIGYTTRLVNMGLDSILAIRLSMLLRKQMGVTVSVFDISKGASIHDIVEKATLAREVVVQKPRQHLLAQCEELKDLVANKLGLPKNQIRSVLPVLPGQRVHLEQWLQSGKRFFAPPWVYRVVGGSLDAKNVASCWAELCRLHGALRTTFVWGGKTRGLVQITLGEQWTGEDQFSVLQDPSKLIQTLIDEHVEKENGKPSDLRVPPASLSFLEASDGQAVVLRVHHALYDAWSIKMIVKDLNELLSLGKVLDTRAPFEEVIQQIQDFRKPDAEALYWKHHLSHAQDTVLRGRAGTESDEPASTHDDSPLGSHFKASYPTVVPQSTISTFWQTENGARISAAIVLAYAKTLGHFTQRSRPTFGLNHASRSLSSVNGAQTLDLTAASVPTLTVTPFCIDLGSSNQRSGASSSSVEGQEQLLDFVQDHLAQLSRFAQSDGWQRYRPRFNAYLNIVSAQEQTAAFENEDDKSAVKVVLRRHRLGEPLASDYFTATTPSSSTVSTIEGLETGHLSPHQLFFNAIVRQGQDVSVAVSGDEGLCGGGLAMATKLVSFFASELIKIMEGACTN